MKHADASILERNVERLLTRAYRPVRMSETFRAALVRRLVQAAAERASRPAPRRWDRPRLVPLAGALAVAAALLLLVVRVWRETAPGDPEAVGPALEDLLAQAGVALRDGPHSAWRAASAIELESGVPILVAWLEVRTGEQRGASLTSGEHTALDLAPRSGLLIEQDGERAVPTEGQSDATATLLAGELAARLDPAQRWRVHAAESELLARGGELTVSMVDPLERAAIAGHRPGIEADRPLARVHAAGGELSCAGTKLHPASAPPGASVTAGFVQAGRWFDADDGTDPLVSSPDRSALDPPSTPPDESGPKPWTLDGHLVFPADAGPAARFQVWLRPLVALPKVSLATRHDFDGESAGFHLEGTTTGPHLVQVERPGFAPWKSGEIDLAPGGALELEVRFEVGGSVEGFVVDAATGAPIPGALVVAERDVPHDVVALDGSWQGDPPVPEELPLSATIADARGAFVLPHLTSGDHVLRATAQGFAAAWARPALLRDGARERVADLALGAGARVHGSVYRDDGSAWSGAEVIAARVEIMSSSGCISYGFARTDDFGAYAIEHLPAGFYVVMNESQQPNATPDWQRLEHVVLREGDDRELDFRTGSTVRAVSGRLLDAAGASIRDATLYLGADSSGDAWPEWSATSTDAEGRFRFQDVLPGRYGIYLSDGLNSGLHLLDFVDVGGAAEVIVELAASSTRLTGVLRAARDGTPLARGYLVFMRRGDGRGNWEFAGKVGTDASGRFSVEGLPEGEYTVLALDTEERCAQQRFGPYSLQANAPLPLELELEPGGSVVARAVDASDHALADVHIWAERGGERAEPYDPNERSAEDGRLRLGALLPGRWTLHAEHEDGASAVLEIDVLEGESLEVELRLR